MTMKKIFIINTFLLSLIATNVMALGSIAEAQIEKRLSKKAVVYNNNSDVVGHINKRQRLGETLPFHIKSKATLVLTQSTRLPNHFNAVKLKRMKLSENYL